jgi:MGT family glycosyltransferase
MSERALTILFMPESAYGPTNNCIGIAQHLTRRGHRAVFASDRSWHGRLSPLGIVEDLVDLAPPSPDASTQTAGQFWKDYINAISPQFAKPTVDQLATVIRPIWEELIAGATFVEPQLREIIARTRPDVIVEDNVVGFPALMTAGVPYVRIVSCNPLEMPGPRVAPTFSGLAAKDPDRFAAFRDEYRRTHFDLWSRFDEWFRAQGAPSLPELEFIGSGDLNLYVYPQELDYTDERPLPDSWHRLDSSVRDTDRAAQLPTGFATGERPVVYFSLGSLGSSDVELMRRVIAALATEPYDVIVSAGPRHEEIQLANNMWGAEFLPQTRLIPLADVVITHGGNNTVTETMHFGKPMVVLPLFWDQYDNAQRVHERGYGVRLATYEFSDDDLRVAVASLLADEGLRARLSTASQRIQAADGIRRAADLIEGAARLALRRRRDSAAPITGLAPTLALDDQVVDPSVGIRSLDRADEAQRADRARGQRLHLHARAAHGHDRRGHRESPRRGGDVHQNLVEVQRVAQGNQVGRLFGGLDSRQSGRVQRVDAVGVRDLRDVQGRRVHHATGLSRPQRRALAAHVDHSHLARSVDVGEPFLCHTSP